MSISLWVVLSDNFFKSWLPIYSLQQLQSQLLWLVLTCFYVAG